MTNLMLRGYLTPDDFCGTDAQKIQAALDHAAEMNIRKVVLTGTYHADTTIVIPDHMHLVLDGAALYADLSNKQIANFSFEQDRIYLQGKSGGQLIGNISLYNTRHAVLDGLTVTGNVTTQFSRDLRAENITVSGALTFGKGTANVIAQYLKANTVVISSEPIEQDVPGRDPTTRNIVLRDSEIINGVSLRSAKDWGLMNILADHIRCQTAAVTLGIPGEMLPAEQYKNLTFTELDTPVDPKIIFHNEYLHAYIR